MGSPGELTVQDWWLSGWLLHPSCWELSVICHNSKAGPVPSLWSSKESVKLLCLVQPSHHRGGAGGPQGGQHLSRVTLRVAESESGPRCPVPRPAVCPRPHAACDKCSSSILQAGILPHPPSFCTNLPRPLRRALTAAESVSSSARGGRGARDPGPSQCSLSLIFPAGNTKGLIPNSRRGNGNPE